MKPLKPNKIYYCRECGSRMLESLVGAENYYEEYPECGKSYPYYKYNQENGKRQYVYEYICPNKRIFNVWTDSHDKFIKDKIITFKD